MYTREEICASCGGKYLFRTCHTEKHESSFAFRPLCPDCRASIRKNEERERDREEREARKKKAEADRKEFTERLKTWQVVDIENVCPSGDDTLYILGNGFDLMHRVPSGYYDFRDSLGKNSSLRKMLESYITVEDIWADLENALAHFDIEAMTDEYGLDTLLDVSGAYEEDSGAAEYYSSVETAANPIITVARELPIRFRKWVETLRIGTADRPLKNTVANGKVLNFNYTEFVEELYGVSEENVCYIHGCRRRQKGKPPEPLVLGHVPGADGEFKRQRRSKSGLRGYRRAFVETVQSSVLDCISEYDKYLTKDTESIIKAHVDFFSALGKIKTVIAIGHSFSETDLKYFYKIKSGIADTTEVKWYFGCYGLRDLCNLESLLTKLGIDKSGVTVFRTDTVTTTPLPAPESEKAEKRIAVKTLCESKDGKWSVERIGRYLYITDTAGNRSDYAVTVPNGIKRAFFVLDDSRLIVVMHGPDPGVLLFGNTDDHWRFIGEFPCDHQHLLVPRLRNVFLTTDDITFVYNNRIRKYSLADCSQIYNKPKPGAKNIRYDGEDITQFFCFLPYERDKIN